MKPPSGLGSSNHQRRYSVPGRSVLEDVDYSHLYDTNDEYVSRRDEGSWEAQQIVLECREFKAPNLLGVVPKDYSIGSIIEIGCATGELLAALPDAASDGVAIVKNGFDISPLNVETARKRYPHISFSADRFDNGPIADVVVLSDVLEHVPDDRDFLRRASRVGRLVLINLPLEDNWLNRHRNYGTTDSSGHLRAYSLASAMLLLADAGLSVLRSRRVWSHETQYDVSRRLLRARLQGHAYGGVFPLRLAKALTHHLARIVRPLGRRLYPSNLFVSACRREDADGR